MTYPARNLLPFFLLLTNCDAGDMDESVGLWNLFTFVVSNEERGVGGSGEKRRRGDWKSTNYLMIARKVVCILVSYHSRRERGGVCFCSHGVLPRVRRGETIIAPRVHTLALGNRERGQVVTRHRVHVAIAEGGGHLVLWRSLHDSHLFPSFFCFLFFGK